MSRHDNDGTDSQRLSRRSFLLGCLSVAAAFPVRSGTLSGARDLADDQAGPVKTPAVEAGTNLRPKYSFDNFVVGAGNRFAHAAAWAVAEQPGKAYNPLYIYGGPGVGKTHLLHAIGNHACGLYPRLRIRYVSAEQFTDELINSIQNDRLTTFHRTYRLTDLLLLDDVQFLENKECTQEQLRHIFNALHGSQRQIVISSDDPPKRTVGFEDRLNSRFEWGLMADLHHPDAATHQAVLERRTKRGPTSSSSRARL